MMKNINDNTVKIGFVSLGCDKNRVDTEYMMSELGTQSGFTVTNDKTEADVIIVNTCGFIGAAKTESIDTIFEMAELKKQRLKKLIITGCFAERYGSELFGKIPELDAVAGIGAYDKIKDIILGTLEDKRILNLEKNNYDFKKRIVSTPFHYAYLRISDGCNNRCSYCAIPSIRGAYRSRTFESIEEELKGLKDGYDIKEIILVAQDVTRYGIDLYDEYSLLKLIDIIDKYGFEWIRLMYCYPELVTDKLIKAVSGRKNLCKYLDIPLQHISDTVLKSMNRHNDGAYAKSLIKRIREADGDIAIRSTFITGYPAETEETFGELCDFIEEYRLNNAGFFAFSKEEGTAAARLKDIHYQTKQRRLKTLQAIQAGVIKKNNTERIGSVDKVLYEGIDGEKSMFYGRNQYNAPDIDSLVYIDGDIPLDVGRFYSVEITGTEGQFDLKGKVISRL
ncbi:MAG: 30S ribosomal protein S12 methylthiotransferase RimO [Clostridiales bacterium]|jgi:ribosomal protein S12 methylthiotransferase|nr:30S ribosomal protein S12 methylthiotransferase RimO [Clostridiales bacterium]